MPTTVERFIPVKRKSFTHACLARTGLVLIVLASWITRSPAATAGAAEPRDVLARGDWWSFQPVTRPAEPDVRDKAWPANVVDRFLLARMEIGRAHG